MIRVLFIFLSLFFILKSEVDAKQFKISDLSQLHCFVNIQVLESFHNEPSMEQQFKNAFGGDNLISIKNNQEGIVYATIANRNQANDLQILIMNDYKDSKLQYVGASLVGPVKGSLVNCRNH